MSGDVPKDAHCLHGYQDVLDVLADPRFDVYKPLLRDASDAETDEDGDAARRSRRAAVLSRVLAAHLSSTSLAPAGPRISAIVREFLRAGTRDGELDLSELAFLVPATVMAELVGFPFDRLQTLKPLFRGMTPGHEHGASPAARQRARAALALLQAHMERAIASATPTPLIADAMAALSERPGSASIAYWCAMILYAGIETTRSLLVNALATVIEAPGDWPIASPDTVDRAIEELLRLHGPVVSIGRVAREDAIVGSHHLRKGEIVHLMLADANRDPDQFPEGSAPCLNESVPRHVAFGHGPTYCLGARLARLELRVILLELAPLIPRLRLVEPAPWTTSFVLRERSALRVRIAPDSAPGA